jgi:uncharacterized protein YuzE
VYDSEAPRKGGEERIRDYGLLDGEAEEEPETIAIAQFTEKDVNSILKALPSMLRVPARRFWVGYDEEADVMYISFRRPQQATESRVREDGIIIRTRGKEIVGLTITDASVRSAR